MSTTVNKLFYNKNRLSNIYANNASYTVLRALDMNILERCDRGDKSALLVTDQQGSTLLMQSQSRMYLAYNPFGFAPTAPAVCQYAGELNLPIIEGYLLGNGHRWLNPSLMRFGSPDQLSPFAKGGINAYSYCGNDPINNTDPSGQSFMSLLKRMNGTHRSQLYGKLTKIENQRNLMESPHHSNSFSSKEYKALTKLSNRDYAESEKLIRKAMDTNEAMGETLKNNPNDYTEKEIAHYYRQFEESNTAITKTFNDDIITKRLIQQLVMTTHQGKNRYYLPPTTKNQIVRITGKSL